MKKETILTSAAPAPIGPYSQAIRFGDFLFVSGQIPINPIGGELIQGDIASETRQVMKNIEAILRHAGFHWHDVVKTTIFLTDMADFPIVNGVYGSYFTDHFPARETVQVSGLPRNVNVEISVMAHKA
jgi:2-iminobutanoate/2-iminopropanoate deaminase